MLDLEGGGETAMPASTRSTRLDHEHWAERRRLQLLDELRGRLRSIDFDCLRDPEGKRRDELCALICRHERGAAGVPHALLRSGSSGRIGFNVPVTLSDPTTGDTVYCHIGCPHESPQRPAAARPHAHLASDHRVCCTSPLGNALLGRRRGETVEVHGGCRTMRYQIVSVG
jgi:hypothetical protein